MIACCRIRVTAAGARASWLRAIPGAHERAVERGENVLKNEHKTSIARVTVEGRDAVVKHYRYMGPRLLLKGLFRKPPAWRSLAAAEAMRRRSVPTPAVIGLVDRVCLGLAVESWLVTEDLCAAVEMDRYILRNFGSKCDRHRRQRFVRAFAEILGTLMGSGICHRDLKTCNILVHEKDGGWDFSFIDLDDVTIHDSNSPVVRDDWILALAQLNPSTPKILPWTDRLRFLDSLAELDQFDRKALVTRVQEISRRRGRAYFSDEGPVQIDFV